MPDFILGPAVCRGCKQHVYFDGRKWCDQEGLGHLCRRASSWLHRPWLTPKGVMAWVRGK